MTSPPVAGLAIGRRIVDDPCRGAPAFAVGDRRDEILDAVVERSKALGTELIVTERGTVWVPRKD